MFSVLVLKMGSQPSEYSRGNYYALHTLGREPFPHPSQTLGQKQCGRVETAWAWVTSGKSVHVSEPRFPLDKMG